MHLVYQTGRQQVWLLPVCFLMAILLALVFLKPDQREAPESTKFAQEPSASLKANAEITSEPPSISEPAQVGANSKPPEQSPRFVKLSFAGKTLANDSPWACVLDRAQQLIWEVKADNGNWQDKEYTYTWHLAPSAKDEQTTTPAKHGTADGGNCIYINCDTAAYIEQMNDEQICSYNNWRLPMEQELRSLDHPTNYTPDIDIEFFPHTMPGLYWSGSESIKNKNLAFAVDFNNNIGYATEKRLAHYVRAVADAD